MSVGVFGGIGASFVAPPAGGTYYDAVMADSPVGYYQLEESSGAVAADSSTSSVDATYVGTPTYGITGAVGNGVDAVSGSCIDVPTDFGSMSAATVEFWWKYTSQSYIFRDSTRFTNSGWYMTATALKTESTARTLQNWPDITDGDWHHIVLTTDGSTITAYADGTQRDNWSATWLGVALAASPLRFGKNGTNSDQWWPGAFDEIAIYDYALTATRILAHAQAAGVAAVP